MTGNVGLDVSIGLIFVYLLHSLYATIIMEIFSSTFGLRARNLNYAIKRMLMDERRFDKYRITFTGKRAGAEAPEQLNEVWEEPLPEREEQKTYKIKLFEVLFQWLSELIGTFAQPFGGAVNLKNRKLYDKFFNQPSIKSLCGGSLSNLPSYIPAETFSKALIDSIRYDDPELPVIASVHLGLKSKNLFPPDSETKNLIESFLRDANNDLSKFQILLERWYNDTMERSKGWFKRTTQIMLAAIGFTLVIAFNVDTIGIIKKLSNDKEARAQMVDMASEFSNRNSDAIEFVEKLKDDSAGTVNDLKKRLASMDTMRKSLERDIDNSRNILASDWHLPDSIFATNEKKGRVEDSVLLGLAITNPQAPKKAGEGTQSSANADSVFVFVHKSVDQQLFRSSLPEVITGEGWIDVATVYYKFWFVYDHIWGYLLTVLAISLGAPFWFDLLNKLVKLRTSQPVDTSSGQSGGATGTAATPAAAKTTLNRVG